MDGELLAGALVEGALPPVGEVIDVVEQAFRTELLGGEVEY